jgi:hypothetical protein
MSSPFARGLVATSPTQYLAQSAAFHAKRVPFRFDVPALDEKEQPGVPLRSLLLCAKSSIATLTGWPLRLGQTARFVLTCGPPPLEVVAA